MEGENRNDAEVVAKQARLREIMNKMKRDNPRTFNQAMKPETPELRNTTVNPRLLAPPQFATTPPPTSGSDPYTASPTNREVKMEQVKSLAVERDRQMTNLHNIIKRTNVHPAVRQQEEQNQRLAFAFQAKQRRDNELLYLTVIAAAILGYHFLKGKVGA